MSARKPKPPNDAAELLPDPEAVDKLTAFFDSLGSDGAGAVSLYAVDPSNRLRRSFLLKIPDAAELDGPEFMSQVLERYGAGEYFAESRDAQTGQIVFSQRFEVGGIGKRGSVIPPAPSTSPASPAPQLSHELAVILERQTALLERLAKPAPMFSGLNVPEIITAVTSALVSVRELVAPAVAAPAPAANPSASVDLILKGIELARELRDDASAGSEEGVLGVFRELLRSPLLASALEERKAVVRPKKIAAPARPASEAAVTEKTAPASPAPEQPSTAAEAIPPATMRRYLSALVSYAERGSDPALYAELALDNVPEDVLRSLVDRPDALEAAIALLPAVAEHREWFVELLGAVRAALVDELDGAGELPKPAANGAAVSAA